MRSENPAQGGALDDRVATGSSTDSTARYAEMALAGGLIVAPPKLADEALDVLGEAMPADLTACWIVTAVRALRAENRCADSVIVAAWLERYGRDLPDGLRRMPLSTLHQVEAQCPVPANVPVYARIVADAARRRAVETAGHELVHLAHRAEPDALRAAVETAGAAVAALGGGSGE